MTNAFATDYVFSFAPNNERFELERADNQRTLIAMRSLLQNFHGVEGFHFVLVGSDADGQCSAELHCNEHPLLQRRIEAIIGDKTIQPFVADLRWRAADAVVSAASKNEVRLMIEMVNAPALSPDCPYQLQIADPLLPSVLSVLASSKTWVDVSTLPAIPVSEAASIRLRINDSSLALVSARQLLGDVNRGLGSGRVEIQWTANQLLWNEGSADVEVIREPVPRNITLQTRDIDDVLRPSLAPIQVTRPDAESNRCQIHFALSR